MLEHAILNVAFSDAPACHVVCDGPEGTDMPRKSERKKTNAKRVTGKVKARKCKQCGHHEIGVLTQAGKFIALKPGVEVILIGTEDLK
jgi:hypothetical protein